MEIFPVRTPIIKPGDDLIDVLLQSLDEQGKILRGGDIVVLAETVMATVQGRLVNLDGVDEICTRARSIAGRFNMDPRLVKVIIDESDEILGGVDHVLLARARGLLLANAGLDASNSGGGSWISLLPEKLWSSIREFRRKLEARSGTSPLGAILADSRVQPLKKGVIGGALAVSGFQPVVDRRGQEDLFGRPLVITQVAVADDLTSAAELLMGEADEQTPFVIIRGAPVEFIPDENIDEDSMKMSIDECLFMNVFKDYKNKKKMDA
ncbi:MAG: coenzyme F420-0:L-glutamate ligase [Promethearchaeota archaeon]